MLVVEDDYQVTKLFATLLRPARRGVSAAKNGQAAALRLGLFGVF
jgi:hypothetical protein